MKKQKIVAMMMVTLLILTSYFQVHAETTQPAETIEESLAINESEITDSEMSVEESGEKDSKQIEIVETEPIEDQLQAVETEKRESEADSTDVVDDPEQKKHIEQSALEGGDIMPFLEADRREVKAYGIDVSSWNGVIDWQKVKDDGVEFAIIRIGYRGYGTGRIVIDDTAIRNLEGAQSVGINIGAYFFSTAINGQEAVEEAEFTLDIIKDYNITYPIVYDCEGYDDPDYRIYNLDKSIRTSNAQAFLSYVESRGYEGMMYSSSSHFTEDSKWEISRLEPNYDVWVAQYWLGFIDGQGDYVQYPSFESLGNRMTAYTGKYRMWQFSSEGIISGIDGYVDLDIEYFSENDSPSESNKPLPNHVDAMYRVYNPNSGEHFYTRSAFEKNHLVSLGWNDEGIGWYAPTTGAPVYRLYNPNAGDHHYTLNVGERDYLVRVGWNDEGIGWYSDLSKEVPLYRVYNPNAVTGTHHYTRNHNEAQYLDEIGWNYEGIGWYGVSPK